jgi:hypothetical protein
VQPPAYGGHELLRERALARSLSVVAVDEGTAAAGGIVDLLIEVVLSTRAPPLGI